MEKRTENDKFYNLFIDVKDLSEIFDEALIVIDANVLLMAYQWRDMTFHKVYDVLNELRNSERLKIPSQVIKEFASNRPTLIQNLSKSIHDQILSKLTAGEKGHKALDTVLPAMDFIRDKDTYFQVEKNYNEALSKLKEAQKKYKNSLIELQNDLKTYFDKDPIAENFKEILMQCSMERLMVSSEDIQKELDDRKKEKKPPGYLDKGHKGDLLIWKEILTLSNNHVIFITRDNKPDWVYSAEDNILGARRELVEEFYNEHGKTFKILTPAQFVERFYKEKGNEIGDEIKEDLNSTLISEEDREGLKIGLENWGKKKADLPEDWPISKEARRWNFLDLTKEIDYELNVIQNSGITSEIEYRKLLNDWERLRASTHFFSERANYVRYEKFLTELINFTLFRSEQES